MTIFVGPNAVGKTNIIESIQLLTALTSFRHSSSADIVMKGADQSKISVDLGDGNRELDIELRIEPSNRKYLLNGKSKRTKDLKGIIPSVTFTPDDLMLIKGSNSERRHALDILGSQLNPNYYTILHDFEKVLRHKNKLLKDEAPIALLDAVNELYLQVGSELTSYRSALFARLMPHLVKLYSEISGNKEQLDGKYVPSWEYSGQSGQESIDSRSGSLFDSNSSNSSFKSEEETICDKGSVVYSGIAREVSKKNLSEALSKILEEEHRRKRTLVGPNHDSIRFTLNGMDSSTFASQGQQRSIVLSWKLAEAALIEEILGQFPVLLLDDVMSELDSRRREALIKHLSEDIQVFITTANIDYFDESMLNRANIIQLPIEMAP